jgi:hypothetical protein
VTHNAKSKYINKNKNDQMLKAKKTASLAKKNSGSSFADERGKNKIEEE